MLPNFLIIGTQKAATTWLAKCLDEHPDVLIAKVKETYFFTHNFERGLEWYESQHFGDWSGQTAIGEATVSYIANPNAPGRIRATLRDGVKLIASLRHPVDRAYSAFWMHLSRGNIPADTDFRTFFLQSDQFGLRRLGYYFAQLSRYLEFFPLENFLILIYEEIKRDGQKAASDCFQFLGVDSQFVPEALSAKANKGIDMSVFHRQVWGLRRAIKSLPPGIERPLASVGRRIFDLLPLRKSYEPLAQGLRQELLSDFMPDIRQLEGLLDRDLSIWYAPQREAEHA
jgi:hypothetical protein